MFAFTESRAAQASAACTVTRPSKITVSVETGQTGDLRRLPARARLSHGCPPASSRPGGCSVSGDGAGAKEEVGRLGEDQRPADGHRLPETWHGLAHSSSDPVTLAGSLDSGALGPHPNLGGSEGLPLGAELPTRCRGPPTQGRPTGLCGSGSGWGRVAIDSSLLASAVYFFSFLRGKFSGRKGLKAELEAALSGARVGGGRPWPCRRELPAGG